MKSYGKKETALFLITCVALFVLANIVSLYAIKSIYHIDSYDIETIELWKKKHVLPVKPEHYPHPFFGIARRDDYHIKSRITNEPLFNWISENTETKETIKVLVLGGSVATQVSKSREESVVTEISDDILEDALNRYFKTNRFKVYNAAIRGGKQPQQYFKYMYLDLVGFRPDVVINIDGFNEIFLGAFENRSISQPAIFPRSFYNLLHSTTVDRKCAYYSNNILGYKTKLPLINFLSMAYASNCHKSLFYPDGTELANFFKSSKDDDYVGRSLKIWLDSSNRLYDALKQKKLEYIHVLQPNQYLADSKKFSNDEMMVYRDLNSNIQNVINENYPHFNVSEINTPAFLDQRYLFKYVDQTVYGDNCCHFNELGLQLIVDDIIMKNRQIFARLLKNN